MCVPRAPVTIYNGFSDPNVVSWALEQPERLKNHDYKLKCHAQKQSAPTVSLYDLHL